MLNMAGLILRSGSLAGGGLLVGQVETRILWGYTQYLIRRPEYTKNALLCGIFQKNGPWLHQPSEKLIQCTP